MGNPESDAAVGFDSYVTQIRVYTYGIVEVDQGDDVERESQVVYRGHRQLRGSTLDESVPEIAAELRTLLNPGEVDVSAELQESGATPSVVTDGGEGVDHG